MNPERLPFDTGLGRFCRHRLERRDKAGPAIGVSGIVERVDADHQVAGANGFSVLQPLYNVLNIPSDALLQRPLIGNGANGVPGSGQAGNKAMS